MGGSRPRHCDRRAGGGMIARLPGSFAMSASLSRAAIVCAFTALASAAFTFAAHAQTVPPNPNPDATLRSTPDTVIWGYITADVPPALTIKSGQTVKIDTVSHQGL